MTKLSFTRHQHCNETIAQTIRDHTTTNQELSSSSSSSSSSSFTECSRWTKKTKQEQKQMKQQQTKVVTGLAFYEIEFDAQILLALKEFFYSRVVLNDKFTTDATDAAAAAATAAADANNNDNVDSDVVNNQNVHVLSEFFVYSCPGNKFLQNALSVAMELDLVQQYHIKGVTDTTNRIRRRPRLPADAGRPGGLSVRSPRRSIRWTERSSVSSSSSSSSPQIDNMYLQPSLKPFFGVARCGHQQQEQEQEQQTQTQLKNLRKFSLSCFKISKEDVHYLRKGILQSSLGELVPSQSTIVTSSTTGTGGSSLEELSFSNVTFVDDDAVQELGEAVASMSSQTITNGSDVDWSRKYLRELSLVGCHLNDEQLETIVRTLMTKIPSIARTSVSSLTNNTKWTTRSTLSKLNLSFNRCGGKCLHALGAWLLLGEDNNNNSSAPPGIISCCSLESLQISNNIKEIPNKNNGRNDDGNNVAAAAAEEEEEETNSNNNNFRAKNSFKMRYLFSHDPQTTSRAAATAAGYRAKNSTLKRLRLDGNPSLGNAEDNDNNLSYLGHFVSNHLLALEELDLDSCGITDTGLAKFASSSSAAGATAAILLTTNHKQQQQQQQQKKNRALRRLRLSGNNSLTSISCAYVIQILQHYPMLRSITSGSNSFKWTEEHENQIRHLINVNDSGRALLYLSSSSTSSTLSTTRKRHSCDGGDGCDTDDDIPVALWPIVYERVNRRIIRGGNPFDHGCNNMLNPTKMAANGIYYLIRNNIVPVLQRTNSSSHRCRTIIQDDDRKRQRRFHLSSSNNSYRSHNNTDAEGAPADDEHYRHQNKSKTETVI